MPRRFVRFALALFIVSVPIIGWAVELGVAITLPHVVGLVLVVLAAATWWRLRPQFPFNTAVLSLVAFFLVAAVSVLVVQIQPDIRLYSETSHAKSIKQLIGLGFGVAVFLSLYGLMRWHGLGLAAVRMHYWTTAVIAVLALMQFGVAVFDITSSLANFPVRNSTIGAARPLSLMYGFPRVSLTMVEPSSLATYLLTGWAFWLYSLDRPTFIPERARSLFLWSGVVLGVAVVVTGSRLAYVVFTVLLLGAFVARPGRVRRAGLVGLSLLVGFLLAGPKNSRGIVATLLPKTATAPAKPAPAAPASVETPSVSGAVSRGVDETAKTVEVAARRTDISVQQRTASYLIALRVFRERPLLGAGFGTSGFYMERYWPSTFTPLYERKSTPTMLSHYAAVAAETGLLGLLCMAAFAAALGARLWRLAYRVEDGKALGWGLAAAVGGYAVGSAATPLLVYQVLLGWLLLAIALSATPRPAAQTAGDVLLDTSLKNRPSIWSMRADRGSMNPGRSA